MSVYRCSVIYSKTPGKNKGMLMSFINAAPSTQSVSGKDISSPGGGGGKRKHKTFLYSSKDRDSGFAGSRALKPSHKKTRKKDSGRGISSFFIRK